MAGPIFARVPPELDFPREEHETLRFWRAQRIFEKTLSKPAPNGPFVFYEGPPTANGLPHNGHVLTRVDQGSLPSLQDDARLRRPAQGGLGHARAAGRGRGREGAAHPRQGRDRGVRRRALRRRSASTRVFRYTRGVGGADRPHRVLGRPRTTRTSRTTELRRERVVGALRALQEGAPLSRTQGRLVVGAGRHRAQRGRGRARATRPSTIRASTSPSRSVGRRTETGARSCGRRRPGLCRRTCTRRCNPTFDYAVVDGDRTRRKLVVRQAALARARRRQEARASSRSRRSSERRSSVVDERYRPTRSSARSYAPPFERSQARRAEHALWRVIAADFVTLDTGTGIVHIAPAFGEDDFAGAPRSSHGGPRRAALLRGEARRHVRSPRWPAERYAGPLGQGLRQGAQPTT